MTWQWAVILAVGAIAGNIVIRRIMRRIDLEEPAPEFREPISATADDVSNILARWGHKNARHEVPPICADLHPSLMEVIKEYDVIQFHPTTADFHVKFMTRPYVENEAFVQIGEWGDGSPVLMRRNPADPQVYISDVEECLPHEVKTLAGSLAEYFCLARREHERAEALLRKKRLRN